MGRIRRSPSLGVRKHRLSSSPAISNPRVDCAVARSLRLKLPVASGEERLDRLAVEAHHLLDDPAGLRTGQPARADQMIEQPDRNGDGWHGAQSGHESGENHGIAIAVPPACYPLIRKLGRRKCRRSLRKARRSGKGRWLQGGNGSQYHVYRIPELPVENAPPDGNVLMGRREPLPETGREPRGAQGSHLRAAQDRHHLGERLRRRRGAPPRRAPALRGAGREPHPHPRGAVPARERRLRAHRSAARPSPARRRRKCWR